MLNETDIVKTESTPQEMAPVTSSISGKTREERVKIYNATNNAMKLDEHLGEVLQVTDIVMYPTIYHDTVTGKDEPITRTVLIDADGNAYACSSVGVASALQQITSIIGYPTWEPPLPIKAVEKKGNSGYKYMTLVIEG